MHIKKLFKRVAKHVCVALVIAISTMAFQPPEIDARHIKPLRPTVSEQIKNNTSFHVLSQDPSCNRNVIMINGVEFSSEQEESHNNTTRMLALPVLNESAHLFVVGGPKAGAETKDIVSALEAAEENGLPTTIFTYAHGDIRGPEGEHNIWLQKEPTETRKLFEVIGKKLSKPVSFFLMSCRGGAATKYVDMLPKDSSAIAISTPSEPAESVYPEQMLANMVEKILNDTSPSDPFDGKNLFRAYMLENNPKTYEARNSKSYIDCVTEEASLEEVAEASFGSPSYRQNGLPAVGLDEARNYLNENKITTDEIEKAKTSLKGILTEDKIVKSVDAFEKKGEISNEVLLVAWEILTRKVQESCGNLGPGPDKNEKFVFEKGWSEVPKERESILKKVVAGNQKWYNKVRNNQCTP